MFVPTFNGRVRAAADVNKFFFDVTTSNVSFLRGSNTEESDVTAGPLPDVTYSRAPRPNQLPRLHS